MNKGFGAMHEGADMLDLSDAPNEPRLSGRVMKMRDFIEERGFHAHSLTAHSGSMHSERAGMANLKKKKAAYDEQEEKQEQATRHRANQRHIAGIPGET
jgi:hypothetical protein